MKIGRMIAPAIASHAALKTGVHGVAAAYLAKTTQASQDLSDAEIPDAIARDLEVVNAIASHAGIATAHQNAPALINTHAALKTGVHGIKLAYKAADENVISSTTLQNDDDLLLAVGANDVWIIRLSMLIIAGAGGGGLDWLFTVPNGGSIKGQLTFSTTVEVPETDLTAEMYSNVVDTLSYLQVIAKYVGGGTAGNLQLQWAQHNVIAENTTMKAQSFMLAHQLAE